MMMLRLLLPSFLLFVAIASNGIAATFVINSPDDASDASAGDGACDTGNTVVIDSVVVAECTLRAAIEEANAFAGPDVAEFDPLMPTNSGATVRIRPTTPLPVVTETLLIDGRTGPGYVAGLSPVIFLSGSQVSGSSTPGLEFSGSTASFSAVYALTIAAWPGDGVYVSLGANDFRIHSCHFGLVAGFFSTPNGGNGIGFFAADRARIGPPYNPCCGEDGFPNVIAASGEAGIELWGDDNVVARNFIGTDRFGQSTSNGSNQYGNTTAGIRIFDGAGNRIGVVGADYEDDGTLRGNVIAGNGGPGIEVLPSAEGTVVLANHIGTDIDGDTALANANGIVINGGPTRIGSDTGGGNLISGNTGAGVYVLGFVPGTIEATIVGNRIGVDLGETTPLGNSEGIAIENLSGVVVRGNVISGNLGSGIAAFDLDPVRVRSNWIGTNALSADLGNGSAGVSCSTNARCEIGGPSAGHGNIIAFNGGNGIRIREPGSQIVNNHIGTDGHGNSMGNGSVGIQAIGTVSGGEIRDNVIAANDIGFRIDLGGDFDLTGNFIGVDRAGNPLPNISHGIQVSSANDIRIGVHGSQDSPADAGNTIAHNGGAGVLVGFAGTPEEITIRGNSIHSNTGLGIALDPAGTPNDASDADSGSNGLQNWPQLNAASVSYDDVGELLTVQYTVSTSVANAIYPLRIDFYTEDGRTWIGQDTYPGTNATFPRTTTIPVPAAQIPASTTLRATATDDDGRGNTSELGAAVPIPVPEPSAMWTLPLAAGLQLSSRRRSSETLRHAPNHDR